TSISRKDRNVVLQNKYRPPKIVNDGETVLKEIQLEDPLENVGMKLVRQAGAKTNDIAGDRIYYVCPWPLIAEGMNPVRISRGIQKTVDAPVMMLKGMQQVGRNSFITIEKWNIAETTLEIEMSHVRDAGLTLERVQEDTQLEGQVIVSDGSTQATVKKRVTKIQRLERSLSHIRSFLEDASQKEVTKAAVKQWLNGLHHLAYDIDDILDALETDAICHEFTKESEGMSSKVRKLIPACCTNFSLSTRMDGKLNSITTRLQELIDEKNNLGLILKDGGQKSKNRNYQTSLVDAPSIVGHEDDKKELLQKLLGNEPCSQNFSIVPIVGMGGIGKTTLARLLYDDQQVKEHFELKAWVCVSEGFDCFNISKVIFQSVGGENKNFADLNLLQAALKNQLTRKRFLLVLDDIWSDKLEDRETLAALFFEVARGSKIIITTRKTELLRKLAHKFPYDLQKFVLKDVLRTSNLRQRRQTRYYAWVKCQKRNVRSGERSTGNVLDSCHQRSTQQFWSVQGFWAEDTTRSTYLVNRSPSSVIGFKKHIEYVRVLWLACKVLSKGYLEPLSQVHIPGIHRSIVGISFWRLADVSFKGKCFTGIWRNHTFEVEPQCGMIDHVVCSHETQTQDLMDYHSARDREQQSSRELFRYREDSNEAAFAVAAVEKKYAHESLTFNDIVACEAKIWITRGLLDKAKGNVLGIEIIRDQSANTLRVS
ncbi:NB-ARC domains-containing protein, partial [Tanacetum coccineum]